MSVHEFAAFRELRDAYNKAATSAAHRGDAEAMSINREAHRDLLAQVKPPRLIPDTIDAKNGSVRSRWLGSGTTRAIEPVRRLARLRATWFGANPSSAIAASTTLRVSGETR